MVVGSNPATPTKFDIRQVLEKCKKPWELRGFLLFWTRGRLARSGYARPIASCSVSLYSRDMIRSFRQKGLERFFLTGSTAGIQARHAKRLRLQ